MIKTRQIYNRVKTIQVFLFKVQILLFRLLRTAWKVSKSYFFSFWAIFGQIWNSPAEWGIAKLSPSSSFNWAELALVSLSPHKPTHPHPDKYQLA